MPIAWVADFQQCPYRPKGIVMEAAAAVFLRGSDYRIRRAPMAIHAEMMRMFDSGSFDIAHLELWLQKFLTKTD